MATSQPNPPPSLGGGRRSANWNWADAASTASRERRAAEADGASVMSFEIVLVDALDAARIDQGGPTWKRVPDPRAIAKILAMGDPTPLPSV
jgi:hypothetical protein